jgi:CheY-like chemotaxis protein
MPDGGSITITVADATLSDAGPAATTGLPLGDYVTIVVADSGIGMSAETQRHMFEPFFTTKGADRGTGLGLATAYGIVRQSGGSIVVESSLGAGAAFTIYLPRLDATAAAKQLRPVPLAHVPAAGMVLLVEDDPSVRRLIQRMLTGLGYEVIAAAVGSEAIEVARGHVGPIHVLLTDVVMAGMSGRELAAILVSERADTRVVFMSGYPDETVLRQDLGHVSFVQKPFTVDTLAESLRAAIA